MAQPNVLVLMVDGLQGRFFDPGHPCRMPHLRALAESGVRVARAYSINPISSPSRASMLTGLLPHNHGVLDVIHSVADDQSCLRREKPHWAQRFAASGYRTGYFGKWHVDRPEDLNAYGWQVNGSTDGEYYRNRNRVSDGGGDEFALRKTLDVPRGYKASMLYGVAHEPAEARTPGRTVAAAEGFLEESLKSGKPWCCFVSLPEPNEPPICGKDVFDAYDLGDARLPENADDDLSGRPGLYRKASGLWEALSERERREMQLGQYASMTEIDRLYGRLLAKLDASGQRERTIVVFTSDHGNLLGAHGLIAHNVSAFEENYHIPMIFSGPDLALGALAHGLVTLPDLGPTLLDLAGLPALGAPDSRSFAALLKDPAGEAKHFQTAYAEYFGARYTLTQRVWWDGDWKFVFNGFDEDELYDLANDPQERRNLARDPKHRGKADEMMAQVWNRVRDTGDKTLWESHWPGVRWARVGPLAAEA